MFLATQGPFSGGTQGKKCVSPLPMILSLFLYQYSQSECLLTVLMVGVSEGIGTILLSTGRLKKIGPFAFVKYLGNQETDF